MTDLFLGLGDFTINLILSFLILVFTLRILLALCSANAYNPITQSIIKISRPIRYLFFFLPNFGKFEISSFMIIFICHFLSNFLGSDIIMERLIILSFKGSIFSILNALTVIFIILAISSWFVRPSVSNRSPVLDIIYQISNPILFLIKRLVPTSVGIIDFSVIIA